MSPVSVIGHSLVPLHFDTYPLGTIKPNGWFRDQLRLSAKGLGGNLFYSYRFVKESTWLGGTWEYTPLNEAAPYWYNYIVPLAYTLDEVSDSDLFIEIKKQAEFFLEYTLSHQAADGWLGPETTSHTRGIWARCLLLQGLTNHAIADSTKRQAIMDAIFRFIRLVHAMLKDNYAGYIPRKDDVFDLQLFGVARAHELALTLQWLYDQTDDTKDRNIIWEVMEMMWQGSRIMERDWTIFFGKDFPHEPSVRYKSPNFKHGVNVAQGLRYPAHLYRMHPSPELANLCKDAVRKTFKYHGTPAGSVSSDEYIGGLSPQRGSELCCSVELMFSLSYLYQLFGDNDMADRVELAAFNAIPAGVSADWWSHQYITQVNQPWACELELAKDEKTPFYDVCRYANVFGLEPEFPCCTVNHPTAYPKMLMNAFLRGQTSNGMPTMAHAHLIPSRLDIDGISINCESNYPFAPCALHYSIHAREAFEFLIRVPHWTSSSSTIELCESGSQTRRVTQPFGSTARNGGPESFHCLQIPGGARYDIFVTLNAEVRVKEHDDKSVSIYYGPLLYAYEVDYKITTRLPRNYKDQTSDCTETANCRDHDYLSNSPWKIGIDPSKCVKVVVERDPWVEGSERQVAALPNPVWASGTSPVHLEVEAAWVNWPVQNGTAADPSVVDTSSHGERFVARLVPYGTAKLHIAQFPVLRTEKT
ncbi:uncharacterized protein BDZ83DRAFT_575663 [Colletotrichum acutatum]|uniref:Non-reducing end beta-L-arabinofuranosidase-like GH127 catalytic domain-containing protein n=1 Tax=Glomerella acutata TaxID=27357 RepID=A0AAD8XFG9_GLOAC|nr:uncharacterized protein BDZ83DRAFT_575663 [Colletotrichum acutatum]KAK1725879.1 hypothetical protein BDZ83DRAFT_575663 [Colletotrichum acutatum]